MARLESDLDTVMTRLARLEDERSVLETMYRYAHSIDYGLEDEWVDCFVEDGTFEVARRGDPTIRYTGRSELAEFVAGHTRPPDRYHKHILVEPRVTVRDDQATAVSYFARLDLLDDGPHIRSFGRYRDRLVRCPDGVWRFAERKAEVEARRKDPS